MSEITYDDKVDLNVESTIANINKVTANDMNEIKSVVNENVENVGDISTLTTTDKTSVVNAINELNAPEKWVSVSATNPNDGRRVWFSKSKNLFDNSKIDGLYPYQATYSVSNEVVTITSNSSSGVSFCFIVPTLNLKANKTYGISFKAENDFLRLSIYDVTSQSYTQLTSTTEGGRIKATYTTGNNTEYRLVIYVALNKSCKISNVQVEEGSVTDYEPYINQGIYVDNEQWYKKGGFVDISDTQPTNNASLWVQPTTQNLLDYRNFRSLTSNGIDIISNHDGTFTINGTATADVSVPINDVFMPMSGTWRMLGCPSGGSSSTYMLSAYVGYWGGGSPNIDTGNGTNITYTGNVKVRFYIKNGTTCNNLVFKPMLTTNTSTTINGFAPKGPNIYALINGQYKVV